MTSNIVATGRASYDVRQHSDDIDLMTLTGRERVLFYAGYRSGVVVGIDMGREQRIAEEEAAWSRMASFVRRMGGPFAGVRFSELAALRGEEERASLARAREDLLFRRVVA